MSEEFYIGELSRRTGVSTQTIRYYERLGLISRPERTETGYRLYGEDDEARLRFIQSAKGFGLSLEEIKELLEIRATGTTPCEHLRGMVKRHLDEVDRRIHELVALREELSARYAQLSGSTLPRPGVICGFIEQETEHPARR